MILDFFRFELREQLRSPLMWLMAGFFALLAFGAASSEAVQIGGGIGNVSRNAPTVIATWLGMFTLLGMLLTTMLITGALLRDFEQGTAVLIFASPVQRRDYLAPSDCCLKKSSVKRSSRSKKNFFTFAIFSPMSL
jgi:ABC-type transport system involved in multi-copper enzyme maturation permease subunit